MAEVKNILASMGIDLDTKRFEIKLRAISKYTEALADELDKIDAMNDYELPTHLEGSE